MALEKECLQKLVDLFCLIEERKAESLWLSSFGKKQAYTFKRKPYEKNSKGYVFVVKNFDY